MRATRDLLRRRTHLLRRRAERLAHVQNTNSPCNRPEIGQKIAYKANRDGVAERFVEPAVQKRIAVALAPITSYDPLLGAIARSSVQTAKHHDANPLSLVHTVPGIGKRLGPVLLDEIHDSARFPRGQACVSYARLVKWAKGSAGKRLGTSGKKTGNAHLKGAFSEAAVLCLRNKPTGQKYLARLEKQHDQGEAFTIPAHKLARAV